MSDHISFNLAKAGYNVAKYVPYGPIASVMPYLIRRADENTSVAGQSRPRIYADSNRTKTTKIEITSNKGGLPPCFAPTYPLPIKPVTNP